jgi:NADH-quinone oxidoreductase subunit G
MIEAGRAGKLGALYVVGANPFARYNVQPGQLNKTFVVVQDMFLTETASMADVVLPSNNAYEKSGSFTNTYGDLQILKKAADFAGSKSDFELIVRIADRIGFELADLVPFGKGVHSDMGQSRGAQSGEADRHEVWLIRNNYEPKMSPLDPSAIFDEIQRLVPGYAVSRLDLFSGNSVHTHSAGKGNGAQQDPALVWPANDTLFTSGTLGRYSNTLNSVMEKYTGETSEVMAD